MKALEHARLAKAYLEQLCDRLDRGQSLASAPRPWWTASSLVVPAAIGLGISAQSCGGTVETGSSSGLTNETACHDNQDNDGDGKTDCADPDCTSYCFSADYAAPYDASPGDSSAKEGGADSQVLDSAGEASPGKEVDCADSLDNDGDGKKDCADEDCAAFCSPPPYAAPHEWKCQDGQDDDYDGLVDCADPDCNTPTPEQCGACNNGKDDDADGLTDCADPGCDSPFTETCMECGDGLDNDGDGQKDCQDSDCVCVAPAYSAPF